MVGEVHLGRPVHLDRHAAVALLRSIGQDRSGMAELRRLYAEEVGRRSLFGVPDEHVIARLAERIATGALMVALVRERMPPAPPEMQEAGGGLVEPQPAAAPAKAPTLSNPRWSAARVQVGAEVKATFTYSGFEDDRSVTVMIFECDSNGTRTKVDEKIVQVAGEEGDHELSWARTPDETAQDLEEDEAEGDGGPLEYMFTAEAKKAGHSGDSGPLWLTNTVTIDLKDEENNPPGRPRVVVLADHEKELRAKSEDGVANFEGVLVGPIKVRLAEPRFSNLAWSAPRVPVGEPVLAVFDYEDAIEGLRASVVIHEVDAGGTMTQVESADITLTGAAGRAEITFTRTEDEVQEDMAEDEREGEVGPLEYRYVVTSEDGHGSEASAPLFLTHTVVIKLENAADGGSFPDGMELVLVGADGTTHRGTLSAGEVRFEGVVCGPVTVKLARGEG